MTRPGCFVTGTGTQVGKTVVTAALARCLADRGISLGVMKPIETGVPAGKGVDSDAELLRAAARVSDPLELISPYRFPDPLAPLAAARRAGITIELAQVMAAFNRLAGSRRLMLTEGVGGVLAPIADDFDTGRLITEMGLPALVVGHAALGGINHALLTIEALRRRGVRLLALVLNAHPTGAVSCPASTAELQEETTTELLRELAGLPVIGPVPPVPILCRNWETGLAQLITDPGVRTLADLVASGAP
jgi:dethiobiotin synthetase